MSTYQQYKRASDQQKATASKFLELPHSIIMQTLGMCTNQRMKSRFQNINSTLDEYLHLPQTTRSFELTRGMSASIFSQSPCLQEIVFFDMSLSVCVTKVVASSCVHIAKLTFSVCSFTNRCVLEPFKQSPKLKSLHIYCPYHYGSRGKCLEDVRDWPSLENIHLSLDDTAMPSLLSISETWTRMKTILLTPFPSDYLTALIDRNQSTLENLRVICTDPVPQGVLDSLSHCPKLKCLVLNTLHLGRHPSLEFPEDFPKLDHFIYTERCFQAANIDTFLSAQQQMGSMGMSLLETLATDFNLTLEEMWVNLERILCKLPRLKYLSYITCTFDLDEFTHMLSSTTSQLEVLVYEAIHDSDQSKLEHCGNLECLRVLWMSKLLPLTIPEDYFQKYPKLQIIFYQGGRKFAHKYDGEIRKGRRKDADGFGNDPQIMKTLFACLDVGKLPLPLIEEPI